MRFTIGVPGVLSVDDQVGVQHAQTLDHFGRAEVVVDDDEFGHQRSMLYNFFLHFLPSVEQNKLLRLSQESLSRLVQCLRVRPVSASIKYQRPYF